MYINTYVLSVPEEKKAEYKRLAELFAEVAIDYGALEIVENWELDVPEGKVTDYRKAVKAKPGEKIVLSWVIWPDRETGAIAHKGMFTDKRLEAAGEMPFDSGRMILGGFEPLFSFRRS